MGNLRKRFSSAVDPIARRIGDTFMRAANNLSDLVDAATARVNLGIPTLASGDWTPTTIGAPVNISSLTWHEGQWSRVGNVVTCSGRVSIVPANPALRTQFYGSLPVASAIAVARQGGGVGSVEGGFQSVCIYAGQSPALTGRMFFDGTIPTGDYWYSFVYRVI